MTDIGDFTHVQRMILTHQTQCVEQDGGLIVKVVGEEEPPPYEPGCPCQLCWGPGKTFGDNPTPKFLYITGSGFPPETNEANSTWVLTQKEYDCCYWEGVNNGMIGYFQFDQWESKCEIKQGAVTIFTAADAPCILEFDQGAKHVEISW